MVVIIMVVIIMMRLEQRVALSEMKNNCIIIIIILVASQTVQVWHCNEYVKLITFYSILAKTSLLATQKNKTNMTVYTQHSIHLLINILSLCAQLVAIILYVHVQYSFCLDSLSDHAKNHQGVHVCMHVYTNLQQEALSQYSSEQQLPSFQRWH